MPAAQPPQSGVRDGSPPRRRRSHSQAKVAGEAARGDDGPANDSPRIQGRVDLFDIDLPAESGAPVASGRTLRNDGSNTAGNSADEERVVTERLAGFLAEARGRAKAEGGSVDQYFIALAQELRKQTENPPKFTEGETFVNDLVEAWKPAAEQYARTGNPYQKGAVPDGHRPYQPLSARDTREMDHPGGALGAGNPVAEVNARERAGGVFRDFADGKFGTGLVALVEFHQDRKGQLLGTVMLRPSGNALFDAHVMKTARLAVPLVSSLPMLQEGAEDFRSLWEFEGRITYFRKVKAAELKGEDVLRFAGMSALSMVTNGWVPSTGRFDELTGEMEIVDPSSPQFKCRVRFLGSY